MFAIEAKVSSIVWPNHHVILEVSLENLQIFGISKSRSERICSVQLQELA